MIQIFATLNIILQNTRSLCCDLETRSVNGVSRLVRDTAVASDFPCSCEETAHGSTIFDRNQEKSTCPDTRAPSIAQVHLQRTPYYADNSPDFQIVALDRLGVELGRFTGYE